MGRQRDPKRRGWEDNLYPCKNGFKYRHPLTRKETWFGTDFDTANHSARKLNAILASRGSLIDKVLGEGSTLHDAIKVFREQDIPHRGWAEKTADEHAIKLRRIERDIGGAELSAFRVKEAADYLRTVTASARARQQYRSLLIWIFDCALQEGWVEQNPFTPTRPGKAHRKRDRLVLEAYLEIHAAAPAWLQNAMEMSLLTLLRREDVVRARFGDVHDGALWIEPGKTKGSTGARLRIELTADLEALARRCRDEVASPFLIHRLPEKARPRDQRAKKREHHTQVLPEQLSRTFAEVRDGLDRFQSSKDPPTFHEIRSLGGALLKNKGWTLEQVQALMAHASGEMTELYLAGHQQPWAPVRPGLTATDFRP